MNSPPSDQRYLGCANKVVNPITEDDCEMSSGIKTCYCSDEDYCNGSAPSRVEWRLTELVVAVSILLNKAL